MSKKELLQKAVAEHDFYMAIILMFREAKLNSKGNFVESDLGQRILIMNFNEAPEKGQWWMLRAIGRRGTADT